MGVLDKINGLPPEVKKKIEEDIENAEFDDKRLGGTDGNPVKADFVILNNASHKAMVSIGRGRKFQITVSKKDKDISVHYRFENHHRSRGWTLKSDVIVLNEEGQIFAQDSWRAGISEKDYGSYKTRTKSRELKGGDGEPFAALVICYRDPSLKFKKVLDKLFDEIKEEAIDAIVAEVKSWFDSDDKTDKGDKGNKGEDDSAKMKRSSVRAGSLKARMDELARRGDDGEDVAELALVRDK